MKVLISLISVILFVTQMASARSYECNTAQDSWVDYPSLNALEISFLNAATFTVKEIPPSLTVIPTAFGQTWFKAPLKPGAKSRKDILLGKQEVTLYAFDQSMQDGLKTSIFLMKDLQPSHWEESAEKFADLNIPVPSGFKIKAYRKDQLVFDYYQFTMDTYQFFAKDPNRGPLVPVGMAYKVGGQFVNCDSYQVFN